MENLVINREFWKEKEVFITGHTGFKGGWLAFWLSELGARVHGYSLPPVDNRSFYNQVNLKSRMVSSVFADIRDRKKLQEALTQSSPEVVFHLAAQPLVRESYLNPVDTYEVNVMGSVNLMNEIRAIDSVKALINITTDKVYQNKEWIWPYRENDVLGGKDPYSSSKACVELMTISFMNSFFESEQLGWATARAGNVLGGGDWCGDRLVPDFFRAKESNDPLRIRNPAAVRPWQHVLEPIRGYLQLAEHLFDKPLEYSGNWNFGPTSTNRSVSELVGLLQKRCASVEVLVEQSEIMKEAQLLTLDSNKATNLLGWRNWLSVQQSIDITVDWYLSYYDGTDMELLTKKQVSKYVNHG